MFTKLHSYMCVSVIIPTYKNVEYLPDCLNSISEQDGVDDIEILLGIDGCEDTLRFFEKNRNLFKDVDVYFFSKNVGCYVVRNTLLTEAKYDKIVFFDSDDMMKPNMIKRVLDTLDKAKLVRFKMGFLQDGRIIDKVIVGTGQFGVWKSEILRLNGFCNWRIAADLEFRHRFYKLVGKEHEIILDEILFTRRRHSKSLTQAKETGFSSRLRNELRAKVARRRVTGFDNPKILNITNATKL